MAIKGVSEIRRLPRLGKLHLGIKKTSQGGKQYPSAVDYFVCTADDSTPQSAVDAFKKVYGDNPKEVKIMFPSNDEEQFFQQWYKRYGQSKGLLCKGDGEFGSEVQQDAAGVSRMVEKKCPCEYLTGDKERGIKPSCRRVANLQFLLPDVQGVGVFQLDTGSYNSIVNINSMVDMVKSMCGKIVGIPLILAVQPQEATVNGQKKTVFVLQLKMNNTLLQLMSANKAKQEEGTLLPPPDDKANDLFPEEGFPVDENPEEPPSDAVKHNSTPALPPPAAKPATPPPAAKPAAPAPAAAPVQQEINMEDIGGEMPPAAPVKPLCPTCKQPMERREGVVRKLNPATGQPFGFVKGWACVKDKIFNIDGQK